MVLLFGPCPALRGCRAGRARRVPSGARPGAGRACSARAERVALSAG
ncbi:hypothetical protein ACIQMJ_02535 [Actinosynnema sp. NPDC091369]